MRTFVLEGADARFPELGENGFLVVKEPNGSVGAPLLVEALPESRVILLVRDPRDVVASLLAAQREGSWGAGEDAMADTDPDEFVRQRARMYNASFGKAWEAYEAHNGRKVATRYEDLRYDALGELQKIYSSLAVPIEEEQLRRVVEKHAWENIPERQKGPNKPRRKAKPGGWREDLTPEQARMVEEITTPVMNEFYPGWSVAHLPIDGHSPFLVVWPRKARGRTRRLDAPERTIHGALPGHDRLDTHHGLRWWRSVREWVAAGRRIPG